MTDPRKEMKRLSTGITKAGNCLRGQWTRDDGARGLEILEEIRTLADQAEEMIPDAVEALREMRRPKPTSASEDSAATTTKTEGAIE